MNKHEAKAYQADLTRALEIRLRRPGAGDPNITSTPVAHGVYDTTFTLFWRSLNIKVRLQHSNGHATFRINPNNPPDFRFDSADILLPSSNIPLCTDILVAAIKMMPGGGK